MVAFANLHPYIKAEASADACARVAQCYRSGVGGGVRGRAGSTG